MHQYLCTVEEPKLLPLHEFGSRPLLIPVLDTA